MSNIGFVSFGEYVEHGIADKITDFTIDGKCSNCGGCCTGVLAMSNKEVDRIKKYIKEHNIKMRDESCFVAVKKVFDMTCPFRDNEENKCMIYEVRPEACRLFICNDEKKFKEVRERVCKSRIVRHVRKTFKGYCK